MAQHIAINVEISFRLLLQSELLRVCPIVAADPIDLIKSGYWMVHGSLDQVLGVGVD